MKLVADSNVLFATIIRRGRTLKLLESDKLELFSPLFALGEIDEHKLEIIKKSGLSDDELVLFIELLRGEIEFVPIEEYIGFFERAMHLSVDPDDVDFFALALRLNCPVWSNDPHFSMQREVRIFSTEGLEEFLSKIPE